MLVAKIPSPNKMKQLKFQPSMFLNLQAGSLLVAYCRLLENLQDATVRVIHEGSFKRIGLVLIVNTKTLDSSDRLTHVNLSLWSLWSSTTVVLKLWTGKTGGIARAEDGMFPTSSIPHIEDMISHGASKLPKLMTTHVCLMCLHKSGRVVANGPPAPIQPE